MVASNFGIDSSVKSVLNGLQINTSSKKRVVYATMNIMGASGSGKSRLSYALGEYLAKELTPMQTNGKCLVIDSEKGSSYSYKQDEELRPDTYDFDVLEVPAPFHPAVLIQAIQLGINSGYSSIVVDSFTPFWNKKGGILELVNSYQTKAGKFDSIQGWAKITPLLDELTDTITDAGQRCHIIVTTRAKSSLEEVTDGNGKKRWVEVPMKAQAREDFKYEFNLVASLDYNHVIKIDKCRPPFSSLDNMTFDPLIGESANDYISRFSNIVIRGLNLEDLSDLRTKSEIANGLVDQCKVRQISFDVISYEVQKRGYGSFKEMPKSKMLEFLKWFDTLEYGCKTHPDGAKNQPVVSANTPIQPELDKLTELPLEALETEPEF